MNNTHETGWRLSIMRRILFPVLLLVIVSTASAQEKKTPVFPEPGSDIPGPFHTYNASGKKKGRFHCLVSEHELNPVVMVIVRGTEVSVPLRYLLVKLDNAIKNNPNSRLSGFAV